MKETLYPRAVPWHPKDLLLGLLCFAILLLLPLSTLYRWLISIWPEFYYVIAVSAAYLMVALPSWICEKYDIRLQLFTGTWKSVLFDAISIFPFSLLIKFGIGVATLIIIGIIKIPAPTPILVPQDFSQSMMYIIFSPLATLIIAPVTEEIYFRGFLYNAMKGLWSVRTSMIVQAILFGAFHANTLPENMVSAFFLGLILAQQYEKHQTLWIPLTIHFWVNVTSVIAGLFLKTIA